MAKDRHDQDTRDWVDDADERREKELQEILRRQARRGKLNERASPRSRKDAS